MNNLGQQQSLLSKLLTLPHVALSFDVRFSDGTSIPQDAAAQIATAHEKSTVEVQLLPGVFLVIDNTLCTQGRLALNSKQSLLMTIF